MTPATALQTLREAGISVSLDGADLIVKAPAPPSAEIVTLIRQNKPALVELLLRPSPPPPSEADITRWLDDHHTLTAPNRCAHCRQVETPAAMVVPFGGRSAGHVWLHPECWSAWMANRRAEAIATLMNERIAP